jgi:PAS domain S-box-containing protein
MPQHSLKPVSDAERRLGDLLESAPDAILEFDGEGRIVLLNRMAEQLFGYTREEMLELTVETLVPEAFRSGHKGHRTGYRNHPVTRPMGSGLKLEARRKDGSQFPVEISLSSVKSGSEFRVTAIIRDITERRQMENQLRAIEVKHIADLELRNQNSERANELKTEFLGNMSHELRSPLHTVIGFAELLAEEKEGALNEKQKRFVGHIRRDSTHLLDLINDLLDLSKIEAGRLELRYEVSYIPQVIEEALSSVRPRASARSVDLTTAISIGAPFARIGCVSNRSCITFSFERCKVHAGRGEGSRDSPALRPVCRDLGVGHGDRHSRRPAAGNLRQVLPGARRHSACSRRHRTRSCHHEAARGAALRNHLAQEPAK